MGSSRNPGSRPVAGGRAQCAELAVATGIDFFESLHEGLRKLATDEVDSGNTGALRRPGERPLRIRTEPCRDVSISLADFLAMTSESDGKKKMPSPQQPLQVTLERKSAEEKARRKSSVDQARASVRLEGTVLGAEMEALNARFVDGEITSAEHVRLGLLVADRHRHG